MNGEIKDAWTTALRSGEYAQGRSLLRLEETEDNGLHETVHCCLGVLCELAVKAGIAEKRVHASGTVNYFPAGMPEGVARDCASNSTSLPNVVAVWAGMDDVEGWYGEDEESGGRSLITHNDVYRDSFQTIADVIENNF